jgi:hypothetical protein
VIAHVESVPYAGKAARSGGLPFLVDIVDVYSRWHDSRGDGVEAAVWRDREAEALRSADAAVAASLEEREALVANLPGIEIQVAGQGVAPSEWPESALSRSRQRSLAMFASWGHGPNRSALEWFAGHVWPQVLARVPDARLLLLGPGQPPSLPSHRDTVDHPGRVEDLATALGRIRVAILPFVDGVGARVKFGEALASGAAVVSTTIGAEGYPADAPFVRAETPEDFAVACIRLLENENSARELGDAGRDYALTRLTWQQTSAPIIRWAAG